MVMGAFAAFFLAAAGCSENETELGGGDGNNSEKVMLGVTTELGGITKAAVAGTAITYEEADYATVPGLGIYITNKDLTDWYAPDAGGVYTKQGKAVWFMGDKLGKAWKSIQTRGASFDAATEVPYYLTKEVGQVYAYYPYDPGIAVISSVGAAGANLKIPVTVKETGTIDAAVNNANKVYKSGKWTTNTDAKKILGDTDEKDFLYFAAADGRYINNGRADGQPLFDPTAGPNNSDPDNPGYQVNLDMRHGMSMISFRVYDGGSLSDNASTFTKLVVRDKAGVGVFKTGAASLSLLDGSILTPAADGTGILTRTVTNYTLMRQLEEGETESETAFVDAGSGNNRIWAQTVCRHISALVYPLTFNDNEIEVEITLNVDSKDQVFKVNLPGITWDNNTNYVYTLRAGRNKLEVVSVSVEDWLIQNEPEIPL